MKRLPLLVAIAAVTLLWAGVLAQSGSELFSQALSKEKTEGKLDEAIVLYQRIASEFATDHALAAKALVQMGHAYEKQGKGDARKAYDRVVREYADQRELAAEAGARIAALDRALAPASAQSTVSGLVARQVWSGSADTSGSTSADGKYLSFTDWTTGDLAIRDLASGENRRATHKATKDEPDEAEESVISPDSSQIAYTWYDWSSHNKDEWFYDLRVIPREGGQPRVLYRNDQILWLRPHAWSPDGQTLAVELQRRDRTEQLALVSVADGSVRVLKSLDWRFPTAMAFSPDGRYLAYDFPPVETEPERDVYVIAVDGSGEAAVVSHPANDVVLAWFPTGQTLLFASDRTGTNSLWSIRVENGRPLGEPKLLKQDIGRLTPSGFTRAGDFYYGLSTGMYDVYVAPVDPATGKVVNEPDHLKTRYTGAKWGGTWSPDGSRLVYAVDSVVSFPFPPTLAIWTSTAGQVHEQTLRVPLSYLNLRGRLAWTKDGGSIVLGGNDLKGRPGLFRFDLSTNQVEAIVLDRTGGYVSPDGRTLFYGRQPPSQGTSQPFGVIARNLASGDERAVYPHPVRSLALSPDGQSLAFITLSRSEDSTAGPSPTIRIMPSRGGPYTDIGTLESTDAASLGLLVWAGNGKSLLFTRRADTGDEVWQLPVEGGTPERVGVTMMRITSLSLHPDGRQLVISSGFGKSEIWVMQNLGAALAPKIP